MCGELWARLPAVKSLVTIFRLLGHDQVAVFRQADSIDFAIVFDRYFVAASREILKRDDLRQLWNGGLTRWSDVFRVVIALIVGHGKTSFLQLDRCFGID